MLGEGYIDATPRDFTTARIDGIEAIGDASAKDGELSDAVISDTVELMAQLFAKRPVAFGQTALFLLDP